MIREAEAGDQIALQHLYKILCPDAPVHVLPERIEQIKADPHNFLFIYEADGNIMGTVFLTICPCPMFGFQPFGVVENFIVDEGYRGQGVGKKLLEHIFATSRANKCTAIKLLSSSHREAAHRFFERNGFDGSAKKGFVKYLNRGT